MLESSFSRVRFVFLVQSNDWRKRIELLKMSLPTLDQSLPWTKKTNRTLENELSNIRSVVALNQENESNSWKWAFQHSISRCFEPRKRIELLKMSLPTLDQSLPWTKKTNRTLENELSNTRSVVALNQENESNSWKWAYQHSISRCPEPRKRIELLKMSFPTFDQSLPWTKKTNRTLENELTNTRSVVALNHQMLESSFSRVRFVFLVQGNDWSNVGKLIFKSSIRFLGSGQRLIECWKAHFQEFDSFSWFRATTEENESNSWKWAFQHSISRCPEPRKRIELLKMSFPTLDQSLPWTKETNRTLENELSNTRSVVALNQENESNSWKWAFQHSISRCFEPSNVGKLIFKSSIRFLGSGQRLIKCWKAHFQEFDSFSWFRATTDRVLESSFSRVRFVFLVQGNDWSSVGKLIFKSSIRFLGSGATTEENESNSWKWAFQHSISRCPEPRKRIELLKMSFPTLDQSLPWTIECWKAHFQEFDSFSWFRARTDRMLESSFSRVRFVYWFRATTDWMFETLIFKSSIRFLGSGQRLIECWKAHFQEFDSFSWFRATTDRVLVSSFSRVRFVFLVQSNDWRKRIELLKMSFPTFDQSLPWTKKTNRTLENELTNTRSVVALNQENESNSWKWAFQHSISRCFEPRKRIELLEMSFPTLHQSLPWTKKRIELLKMSLPTFDQSLPWTKKTNRTLENELSNTRSVLGLNQENESNSWKWAFQYSISRCPEPRKRIELLKMSFPTLDQSLPWTKKTNRTLENELSNTRSVVALNRGNESNSWKWAFQHSISRCPEPRKRIELLKMSFPTLDQSLPWTKKTNRTLENELSNTRSVVALNQENESNSWKWAFQHSISRCPEPRKRIELLKMSFPTLDQSLPWTKKTNRTLENELTNTRSVVALNHGVLVSSFSRVRFVFLVQGKDWSNVGKLIFKSSIRLLVQGNDWSSVGKLIFKSSIRFLGSGQRLIECWKAHFQEFDSFSWFKATTEENESNSWKWAYQHSISRCPEPRKRIELLKMSFPTFDQSLPWTKKTNRTLENELSNTRSVVALNQENESNSWKWAYQHSISRCPEPRKRIELLKMSLPTLDQSLPWTKKTNRTLENELTNIRSVVALNQENESNSWKWAFQHSISRCPEPRKRIELLKMSLPTLDQSLPWTKKTNRTLENELTNTRSVVALNHQMLESSFSRVRFVFLVQGNDWSNVGKLIFKSSIRFLGSGQGLIECWKAHFQEFDSFSWFRATTDRVLVSSFSRVRFVSLVQGNDWRKRIELLKMSFPTLDQSLPWTKKTNRTLENELSNIRSVVALNQGNESNSWKWAYQHSISRCPEPRKRIELLKLSFPTLDQSLPWTKKTNRTLENELSNTRSVLALNQENESNSWKWAFQHSISRCPEPRKRIELLKMSFPTLHQSLPWTKKTNRTLENELSNTLSVVALNQENESNSWKWAFQHSISRCPEPRERIELLKMSFPTFDQSLPWTKKTNRTLENELSNARSVVALNQENESNSWKWAYQYSISRCPEPSSVGKLIFKSSIRFLVQGKDWSNVGKLIFKSSIRLLVQGNDWSSVGKLIFKSSIRFLGSGQRLIECWKAHFQEFDSFSWFKATTEENESNSWKWAYQHSISRCPEPRKRIELLKMSFPTFDQSLPWTKKTNRTLENELSNTRSVVALNQENESNSWKWAYQHSISRCPEPRKRIELLKMSFPTLDQSLPWTKKTNRTLENELTNIRSVVALNQENESNSWKWAFQHSISRCPEPRKRIELLKMSFPTFDQSLPWTKKTNRTLENELSNTRSVVALNQENESNSWKWAFQHSISRCPEPRKRIELLKMSFPTLDQSLPWTKKTNRTLENELSNIRSVVALNQENESNSWKWAFQHSISRCPEPRKRIELLKMSFPILDQSLPWTKKTNRTLEMSLPTLDQSLPWTKKNESNSWKWAFQHSISRCPEPRKRIELLKMSLPTLDQSLLWTKKTNRTLENELSNIRSVVALNHRVLESSFSRVRFVFLVQGNDWSNIGKLIFKSSIRFLGSGQRLIECWKAHFQEFDSFSWFRATTDRVLESSFSRVRFVFLVQGNDWSSVGKLIFKSSIRFLGSGQRLIECWKAHFQEFDSFSWFRATTDRMLVSSFSRVRFVFLVQGNDWSSVGKLIFKSSIRFLGSKQRLIECW